MNITKEETGELTATINIEVKEEDIKENVNKVLKDYQRKANIPGFRPGKVPLSIINKMYGKAVKIDEVNKLLSESLSKYLKENQIETLGHPLANTEKTPKIDFEHEKEYSFYFDIGLAPKVDFELSDKIKVDRNKIKVDEKTINKYLNDVRKRYGNQVNPETSEENDILKGKIEQLDDNGKVLENGISNDTSILISFIKQKEIKNKFLNVSKGDKIIFNPLKATKNDAETASMLNIKKEKVKDADSDFQFTINEIIRTVPADMNNDLYKKVFPNEKIENAEQFKERLVQDITRSFEAESEKNFMNNAVEKLIDISDLNLPDDFLKRWLIENNKQQDNENKITPEQIENEYDNYAKSLKWQLIQNKIVKDNNIKVEDEEIREFIKSYFKSQMLGAPDNEESQKQLDSIVDSFMKNEEEIHKITDQLYDQKIKNVLKSKLKTHEKVVSYDDFIKLVTKS